MRWYVDGKKHDEHQEYRRLRIILLVEEDPIVVPTYTVVWYTSSRLPFARFWFYREGGCRPWMCCL